jgi:hypothetical protein
MLPLVGCSTRTAVDVAPEDTVTRLPATTDINIKAWLDRSREELAQEAAEQTEVLQGLRDRLRSDPASAKLLPKLRLPVQGVVFAQAIFDPDRGFSIPPYLQGEKDAAVAAHLAAFGDTQAAAKLGYAGPQAARNYPVEWTQAVGAALAAAELRLSMGELQAAADLVHLHAALRELLDDAAKQSPLGTALLSAGKRTLSLAVRAYRDPKINLTAVASDVEEALNNWGETAAPRFLALDRAGLSAVWSSPVQGAVAVASDADVARVMDLLQLALPADGVIAVAGFLDEKDRLATVQVAYRSGLDTLYPHPGDLAYRLEEQGLESGNEIQKDSMQRQMFSNPKLFVDVVRTNGTPVLGAVVSVAAVPGVVPARGSLNPRELGIVHLDRPFESCRVLIDPKLRADPLLISDPAVVERLCKPLPVPVASAAELEREGDLVASVRFSWSAEMPREELGQLLAGLWKAYGCAIIEEPSEKQSAPLTLRWSLGSTQVQFHCTADDKGSVLVIRDATPKEKQGERAKAAHERDRQERAQRLAQGKAFVRLATGPGEINGYKVPGLKLGVSPKEAEAALPTGKDFRRTKLADGLSVLLDTPMDKNPYTAKQVLIRYTDEKVSEIRIRYLETDAKSLKAKLEAEPQAGLGELVPADWLTVWAEDPEVEVMKWRWLDDQTEKTYQRDSGGGEVIWRNRNVSPTPWSFVLRGPGPVGLGADRETFLNTYGTPPTTSDAATVFAMSDKSPYRLLLVWFEGDKANRIVAVHREGPKSRKPSDVKAALLKAWALNLHSLGIVRREDPAEGAIQGTLYWHDDTVRVQTTVVENDKGLQMMTEWRSLPFQSDRDTIVLDP